MRVRLLSPAITLEVPGSGESGRQSYLRAPEDTPPPRGNSGVGGNQRTTRALGTSGCDMVITTWVNIQSEVLAEYVSTRVTEAAEVGSIHIP